MTDFIEQIQDAIYFLRKAPEFIRTHKLWKGYWAHGWVAKWTILLGAAFTVLFFLNIHDGITDLSNPTPTQSGFSLGLLTEKLHFNGGVKYLLLIILEMLIFHFSVRTLDILSGQKSDTKPKDFINAQVRMIKISLRNYFLELCFGVVIALFLSVLGFDWIKQTLVLILQFYFIGFAFMDNYFEQKNLNIKESAKYIRQHSVAAIIIGASGYLLFSIPLLGALIAPFICSVAATSYLYYKSSESGDAFSSKTTISTA